MEFTKAFEVLLQHHNTGFVSSSKMQAIAKKDFAVLFGVIALGTLKCAINCFSMRDTQLTCFCCSRILNNTFCVWVTNMHAACETVLRSNTTKQVLLYFEVLEEIS